MVLGFCVIQFLPTERNCHHPFLIVFKFVGRILIRIAWLAPLPKTKQRFPEICDVRWGNFPARGGKLIGKKREGLWACVANSVHFINSYGSGSLLFYTNICGGYTIWAQILNHCHKRIKNMCPCLLFKQTDFSMVAVITINPCPIVMAHWFPFWHPIKE